MEQTTSLSLYFNTTLEILRGLIITIWLSLLGTFRALLPAGILPRKNVKDNLVLITGSGSGIGRMLSHRFAKLEARLILWDIDENSNEETARMVKSCGADVHTYTVDLSNRENIQKTAELVKKEVGPVDILINNAGIVTGKNFLECPDILMERTMDVNINAHFWTTKAFLSGMMERNHGHLVSIASAAGLFGTAGLADYCASKFAAVGFMESLLLELTKLKKDGVHITGVCPFFINTGMFDGVSTKWPSLIPILEPDYVVERIMDAILTNTTFLIMPRFVYLVYFVKSFLPASAQLYLGEFFGVIESMDSFIGRQRNRA